MLVVPAALGELISRLNSWLISWLTEDKIQAIETIKFSYYNLKKGLIFGLIFGLIGLVFGLTFGLIFSALADPTRRAILAHLARGEASVTELAQPFEMSLPAISKHLKVLERAQLIVRGREATWRPCHLNAEPLKDIDDWLEQYRQFWEERLDRLDDYLNELQAKEENNEQK